MTATTDIATITIKPRRALPFFSRHPWVFATAVQNIQGDPEPGQDVLLRAHDGKFIARGLFNPHSHLRVRLYSWDESVELTREFWSRRIDDALALRRRLFPHWGPEFACRLINSEGDQLSGLTVDRYGEWLIVQITSLALAQRQEMLMELLREKLQPQGIWLRTEKGIRAAEGLEQQDGLIWGAAPPRPLFLEENGIRYGTDLVEGQKTGFYLDQRDNRRFISQFVAGQDVLDVCCYQGGFSLNCLKLGHAKSVLAVDSSESALSIAQANAELNGVADRLRFLRQDSFKALEDLAAAGERFDTIVLDPPKLGRNRAGLDAALRGYYSLNKLALEILRPGGLLFTCSCSGLVTREMFLDVLAKVAVQSRRTLQVLEVRGAALDHPRSVTCPEADYLKCVLCRVV